MPTMLPNGLEVINVTAHPLIFWDEQWPDSVTVESECVINASPSTRVFDIRLHPVVHTLATVSYKENYEGRQILDNLKQMYPSALVIGSIITAQGFPEEVYAPIPHVRGRKNPDNRLLKPNRFTVYPKKEEPNNGKEHTRNCTEARA
jgi:hypothetical protein